MSIFANIFGNAQSAQPTQATAVPAQAQANQPAPPGNIPAPQVPAAQTPNGEASAPVPQVPETPADPLDAYKDLWNTDPNSAAQSAPESYMPELSQETLAKTMGGVDFTKHISPDLMATINAGGEEATAAMLQAINTVAQQSMMQATLVASKLSNQGISKAASKFQETLPEFLRSQQANTYARDTNPLFNNPAVKPVMEATQAQILQKFPNATPAEVTKMTQDYILAMGQAFAPKPEPAAPAAGDVDWSTFLGS